MAELIDKKRLDYMNAYIKEYSDGTEILQSYNTDVVKKTPEGKYIRLWHSWSNTTSKQVNRWCGHSFRQLPYEDGTYEDCGPVRIRKGFDLYRHHEGRYEVKDIKNRRIPNIQDIISRKDLNSLCTNYNSAFNKELSQIYKNDKRISSLLKTMYICAKQKELRNPIGIVAKVHNFDFIKVFESTLKDTFNDWIF